MHLISVNLHDWRPSSISTPKISHVAKNGQWFRVNKKGNTPLILDRLNKKGKKRKTRNEVDNDGEIKLKRIK